MTNAEKYKMSKDMKKYKSAFFIYMQNLVSLLSNFDF